MRKNFLAVLLLTGFVVSARGQVVDTVQTFDFGKMPPVYFSNKVYWERNYDNQNHLLFQALKYNSCFIGTFIDYWENGQVKTTGQYVRNKTKDWSNLNSRGFCNVKDSVWKNYNKSGALTLTVVYKKGAITKEY